jgi:hypothetical protein
MPVARIATSDEETNDLRVGAPTTPDTDADTDDEGGVSFLFSFAGMCEREREFELTDQAKQDLERTSSRKTRRTVRGYRHGRHDFVGFIYAVDVRRGIRY